MSVLVHRHVRASSVGGVVIRMSIIRGHSMPKRAEGRSKPEHKLARDDTRGGQMMAYEFAAMSGDGETAAAARLSTMNTKLL